MAQLGVSQAAAAPLPPQNLDAEETVLGALMLAGRGPIVDDVIATGLRPADFYRDISHGRIYRAAVELHQAGIPIDSITVADHLERAGHLDQVGGREMIHEIASIVPAASNAVHYARIVRDMAKLRQIANVGTAIARLAYDRAGEVPELLAKAAELAATIHDGEYPHHRLRVETWREFEQAASERIPTIVEGLWPEAALGFIAAPPKKGKTWIGLSLALAVATGRPFLGRFQIPQPRPVIYLALEGHRGALRARIGALAHGLGVDPDDDHTMRNLRPVYKPAGINLADPAWIRDVQAAVRDVGAQLLVVDVLRAAAQIKENSNEEFAALRNMLEPINQAGCAIALLHHFGKLTEISRDRTPGERMSGTGAMYGAMDVGIFITGADKEARELRLEFELRDLATPDTIGIRLAGEGTGDNHGFVYRDTAAWEDVEPPDPEERTVSSDDIYELIKTNDGVMTSSEILTAVEADGLSLSENTLRNRERRLEQLGVTIDRPRGKPKVYRINPDNISDPHPPHQQTSLEDPVDNSAEPPQQRPRSLPPQDPYCGAQTRMVEPTDPRSRNTPAVEPIAGVDLAPVNGFHTPAAPHSPKGETHTADAVAHPQDDDILFTADEAHDLVQRLAAANPGPDDTADDYLA